MKIQLLNIIDMLKEQNMYSCIYNLLTNAY